MILWVFKSLLSLIVLGLFATLVFVKTATNKEEDVLEGVGGGEDESEEEDLEKVYPPHMWKGTMVWMILIYGLVNLIMISRFFK